MKITKIYEVSDDPIFCDDENGECTSACGTKCTAFDEILDISSKLKVPGMAGTTIFRLKKCDECIDRCKKQTIILYVSEPHSGIINLIKPMQDSEPVYEPKFEIEDLLADYTYILRNQKTEEFPFIPRSKKSKGEKHKNKHANYHNN